MALQQPIFRDPWASTHPFITFHFDASTLLPETWACLGECSSKIEHVSGAPLRPDKHEQLNRIYLAKGVHATTAIEGNTLSEEQVAERLRGDLDLPISQDYLGQEVDNIVGGYNHLIHQIEAGAPLQVRPRDLKTLNAMVLGDLEVGDDVVPGRFRHHVVGVMDYRSPPADQVEELVERLCSWLNGESWNAVIGSKFVLPIIQAILAHLYIAWIHPFGDGNGRTARLVEFDILVRAGVPPASAHLLSDHYNKTRNRYYMALSHARRDPAEFIRYAVQGFVDGLREQLVMIRGEQLEVAWINYVHSLFRRAPHTEATARRRLLALELSHRREPVKRSELTTLTTDLALRYGGKTDKTLSRDLNVLKDMGLVISARGRWRAQTERIMGFLPFVNPEKDDRQPL